MRFYNKEVSMKLILGIMLLMFSFAEGYTIKNDVTFQSVYSKKENSNKLILMIYTAKTCPQCAYMKEKVFKDDDVKSFMEHHFVVLEKNIDTDELPSEFDYFGIPTMFFINKEGKQVDKIIGSSRAKPFLENLKKIVKDTL